MKNVHDFAAEVRAGLEGLRSERAAIPGALEAAVRQSDGARVRLLKQREVELGRAIIDYAEDAQRKLAEASPEYRKPLQLAVRDAEAEIERAKTALEAVRAENLKREAAAVLAVREAEHKYNDRYAEHRNAADDLHRLETELKSEFAAFAGV